MALSHLDVLISHFVFLIVFVEKLIVFVLHFSEILVVVLFAQLVFEGRVNGECLGSWYS